MAAHSASKATRSSSLRAENEGGRGLVARGVVTSAEAIPRKPGLALQPTGTVVGISDEATAFLEGFS